MGFASGLKLFLYYLSFPITMLLGWILTALAVVAAPFLLFIRYSLHGCSLPFRFLARFEVRVGCRCAVQSDSC